MSGQTDINSRAQTLHSEKDENYIGSDVLDDQDIWGQPPISKFILVAKGNAYTGQEVGGVYVCSSYPVQMHDYQFLAELETWELASSEALDLIDRSLD